MFGCFREIDGCYLAFGHRLGWPKVCVFAIFT